MVMRTFLNILYKTSPKKYEALQRYFVEGVLKYGKYDPGVLERQKAEEERIAHNILVEEHYYKNKFLDKLNSVVSIDPKTGSYYLNEKPLYDQVEYIPPKFRDMKEKWSRRRFIILFLCLFFAYPIMRVLLVVYYHILVMTGEHPIFLKEMQKYYPGIEILCPECYAPLVKKQINRHSSSRREVVSTVKFLCPVHGDIIYSGITIPRFRRNSSSSVQVSLPAPSNAEDKDKKVNEVSSPASSTSPPSSIEPPVDVSGLAEVGVNYRTALSGVLVPSVGPSRANFFGVKGNDASGGLGAFLKSMLPFTDLPAGVASGYGWWNPQGQGGLGFQSSASTATGLVSGHEATIAPNVSASGHTLGNSVNAAEVEQSQGFVVSTLSLLVRAFTWGIKGLAGVPQNSLQSSRSVITTSGDATSSVGAVATSNTVQSDFPVGEVKEPPLPWYSLFWNLLSSIADRADKNEEVRHRADGVVKGHDLRASASSPTLDEEGEISGGIRGFSILPIFLRRVAFEEPSLLPPTQAHLDDTYREYAVHRLGIDLLWDEGLAEEFEEDVRQGRIDPVLFSAQGDGLPILNVRRLPFVRTNPDPSADGPGGLFRYSLWFFFFRFLPHGVTVSDYLSVKNMYQLYYYRLYSGGPYRRIRDKIIGRGAAQAEREARLQRARKREESRKQSIWDFYALHHGADALSDASVSSSDVNPDNTKNELHINPFGGPVKEQVREGFSSLLLFDQQGKLRKVEPLYRPDAFGNMVPVLPPDVPINRQNVAEGAIPLLKYRSRFNKYPPVDPSQFPDLYDVPEPQFEQLQRSREFQRILTQHKSQCRNTPGRNYDFVFRSVDKYPPELLEREFRYISHRSHPSLPDIGDVDETGRRNDGLMGTALDWWGALFLPTLNLNRPNSTTLAADRDTDFSNDINAPFHAHTMADFMENLNERSDTE